MPHSITVIFPRPGISVPPVNAVLLRTNVYFGASLGETYDKLIQRSSILCFGLWQMEDGPMSFVRRVYIVIKLRIALVSGNITVFSVLFPDSACT